MNYRISFILFFICLFNLQAVPVKLSSFKYWKSVTLKEVPTESLDTIYGVVSIDEELSIHSGANDVRLVLKDQMVPYRRRNVEKTETDKTGSVSPKIIFDERNEYSQKIVLELPTPPKNTQYVSLELDSDKPYDLDINLSMGMNPKEFTVTETKRVVKYKNAENQLNTVIQLDQPGKYKYIQLDFVVGKYNFRFPAVNYIPTKSQKNRTVQVDVNSLKTYNNNDLGKKVYLIPNQEMKPFTEIEIDFQEDVFEREVEISYFSIENKAYEYISSYPIKRLKGEKDKISIPLQREIRSKWKLEIKNGDSDPLTLTSLELKVPQQELIFEITREMIENPNDLRVYYGNPYAYDPIFDLSGLEEYRLEGRKAQKLSLAKQETNSEFAYSMMEPPVSTTILRVLFILGLGLLVFPVYKVFLLFSENNNKEKLEG